MSGFCLSHIRLVQHTPVKAEAIITWMSESGRKPKWPTSGLAWKRDRATDSRRSIFVLKELVEKDKN